MSVTASSTRPFCRSHIRPPSLASVGRLLAPPTYFCTRPIFAVGHVELRPAVRTPAPGAPRPGRSFPAASGRGIGRCRGRRGPPGRPRGVRGSCRSPARAAGRSAAAGRPGGTARRCSTARSAPTPAGSRCCSVPMGKCRRSFAGGLRAAEDVAEPADLGVGLADDEHLLARAGLVQFVADPVDVAAEPLDRFDPQPAGRFQRRRGHGRRRDRGKAKHLLENVGNGVQRGEGRGERGEGNCGLGGLDLEFRSFLDP